MYKRLAIVVTWLVIGLPYLLAQQQNLDQVKSILQRLEELEAKCAKLQAANNNLQANLAQSRQQIHQLQNQLRRSAVRITYLAGQRPEGIANGTIASRTLRFTKAEADSSLRITYSDTLRARSKKNTPKSTWQIFIDDKLILTTAIYDDHDNHHRRATTIGYAEGIPAGEHRLTIKVTTSNCDPWTGWNSDFLVEVQEIPRGQVVRWGR